MPETPEYLRGQARKCRNLSKATVDKRVAETLRGMADDYEKKAAKLEVLKQKPE